MKFYRIFIPKNYNDGKEIPEEIINRIADTIQQKFEGYSLNPYANLPAIEGSWKNKDGKSYEDKLYCFELVIEDNSDNKKWIMAYKELIRQDLNQEEIFIIEQYAELV